MNGKLLVTMVNLMIVFASFGIYAVASMAGCSEEEAEPKVEPKGLVWDCADREDTVHRATMECVEKTGDYMVSSSKEDLVGADLLILCTKQAQELFCEEVLPEDKGVPRVPVEDVDLRDNFNSCQVELSKLETLYEKHVSKILRYERCPGWHEFEEACAELLIVEGHDENTVETNESWMAEKPL